MKITVTVPVIEVAGKKYACGSTIDVDDSTARSMVGDGLARISPQTPVATATKGE